MSKFKRMSAVLVAVCTMAAGSVRAADQASPKAAALAFGNALLAGDDKGVREASTGSEADYKTVGALGTMVSAMKKMSDAAAAKFGKDNAISKNAKDMDVAAELEKSEVKEEGDKATITNKTKDEKNPMKLVKKDGKWFVDLASLPKDGMDMVVKMSGPMSKAATEVAGEIKADKYKTADEAMQAMNMKMLAAMTQSAPQPPAAPVPDSK